MALIVSVQAELMLISGICATLCVIASWQNLRDNRGIDRLTWLLAIWLPFGFIFFWLLRDQPQGPQLPPPDPNYAPPPTGPESTADAVTAALADEARRRRESKNKN